MKTEPLRASMTGALSHSILKQDVYKRQGQEVAVTETATSFVNERQKVTVSLEKAIEKNDIFNIGNGDEMKNISFGLFAAEELVSASGTSIPADGLIEIISLSENGKAVIKTDLPPLLVAEIKKQGIAEQISEKSVSRFLKMR